MDHNLFINHRLNRKEALSRLDWWLTQAEGRGGAQLDRELKSDLNAIRLLVTLLRTREYHEPQ